MSLIKSTAVQTLALSASFYVAWIGCIMASFMGNPTLYAAAATIPFVFISYWFERKVDEPVKPRIVVALVITLVGSALDSVLMNMNLLILNPGAAITVGSFQISPFWYVCIWLQLALSVLVWARWKAPMWLWAILGSAGGPLSFLAAEKMSAIKINYPIWAMALVWAIAMPVMVRLAKSLIQPASPS